MSKWVYMSQVSTWWTMARQQVTLEDHVGDVEPEPHMVYADRLNGRRRRLPSEQDLPRRAALLAAMAGAGPAQTLLVASRACLAASADDHHIIVGLLDSMGASLEVVGEPAGLDPEQAWRHAQGADPAQGYRLRAAEATRTRLDAIFRQRAETIREYWGNPLYTARELCDQAGLTINTAGKYLGENWHSARLRRRAIELEAEMANPLVRPLMQPRAAKPAKPAKEPKPPKPPREPRTSRPGHMSGLKPGPARQKVVEGWTEEASMAMCAIRWCMARTSYAEPDGVSWARRYARKHPALRPGLIQAIRLGLQGMDGAVPEAVDSMPGVGLEQQGAPLATRATWDERAILGSKSNRESWQSVLDDLVSWESAPAR